MTLGQEFSGYATQVREVSLLVLLQFLLFSTAPHRAGPKSGHSALKLRCVVVLLIISTTPTLLQCSALSTCTHNFNLRSQVEYGIERVKATMPRLLMLAQGGTAVGTGLNSVIGFDVAIAKEIAKASGVFT